jgi:uncharacterized protein YndB with AHSA1/START domain
MSTDRIEKEVVLRAPRARVWRALVDAAEFGQWFGVRFEGPFAPGARVRGVVKATTADPGVAATQKKHEGLPFEIVVEQIVPERLFSFRWHPNATDPTTDYSGEPTTLIVFTLEDTADGVRLTVVESGFDRIPLARRAQAYKSNDGGWTMVMQLIAKHLANAP